MSSQGVYKVELDEKTSPCIIFPDMLELRLMSIEPDDLPDLVTMLNDPSIGRWSYRRPYPYTLELSRSYTEMKRPDWQIASAELSAYVKDPTSTPKVVGNYPLCALKYIPSERGSGKLDNVGLRPGQVIGDLYFFPYTKTQEEEEEMFGREPRDQVWEVAYDLLPHLQGKGLGYRLLRAGLEGWIQLVGIGKVVATTEEANEPSRGLVQKCGFKELERAIVPWPADKGGGERKMVRYVWSNPDARP